MGGVAEDSRRKMRKKCREKDLTGAREVDRNFFPRLIVAVLVIEPRITVVELTMEVSASRNSVSW